MTQVIQVIGPVVRPRSEAGIDYSNVRYVLARAGRREVHWFPGGRYWSSIGAPQAYACTELLLIDADKIGTFAHGGRVCLSEGGRLSRKLIDTHAKAIDEWLGATEVSAAARIDPRRKWTVEVTR